MTKKETELTEFKVLYSNSDQEIIKSETLLTAQLEAHKRAIVKKTIVISVKPL
jgi:DNA repair protein RadC